MQEYKCSPAYCPVSTSFCTLGSCEVVWINIVWWIIHKKKNLVSLFISSLYRIFRRAKILFLPIDEDLSTLRSLTFFVFHYRHLLTLNFSRFSWFTEYMRLTRDKRPRRWHIVTHVKIHIVLRNRTENFEARVFEEKKNISKNCL